MIIHSEFICYHKSSLYTYIFYSSFPTFNQYTVNCIYQAVRKNRSWYNLLPAFLACASNLSTVTTVDWVHLPTFFLFLFWNLISVPIFGSSLLYFRIIFSLFSKFHSYLFNQMLLLYLWKLNIVVDLSIVLPINFVFWSFLKALFSLILCKSSYTY